MTRLASVVALVAAAAVAAGCAQQTAPDVMLITRSGSIPGARLSLRITDDGRVSCNRGALVDVTDPQLIEARALSVNLAKAAKAHVHLAPRPRSTLSYTVRLEQGTLRFSDNSRGASTAMFQLAFLARRIARGPCRLAR